MNTLGSAILGISLIVSAFILSPFFKQSTIQPGRFQMYGVPGHAYIYDTVTGQVWEDFATPSSGRSSDNFNSPKIK